MTMAERGDAAERLFELHSNRPVAINGHELHELIEEVDGACEWLLQLPDEACLGEDYYIVWSALMGVQQYLAKLMEAFDQEGSPADRERPP
jgi:hypothetical protein